LSTSLTAYRVEHAEENCYVNEATADLLRYFKSTHYTINKG
jgi:hypothetical protein